MIKKLSAAMIITAFVCSFFLSTPILAASLAAPTKVQATPLNGPSIKISWNKTSGAIGYEIYFLSDGVYDRIASTTKTSYIDSSFLSDDTAYTYKVRAYTLDGKTKVYSGFSQPKTTRTLFNGPMIIRTDILSNGSITVNWLAATDAQGYIVYRSTAENGTYTAVKTVSETSFIDADFPACNPVYYKVQFYMLRDGKKIYSALSDANAAYLPPAPKTVIADALTATSITVEWNEVAGATGYEVYRSETEKGRYKLAATCTDLKNLYIVDKGLKSDSTYSYKVKAYFRHKGKKLLSEFSYPVSTRTLLAGKKYHYIFFFGTSLMFHPKMYDKLTTLARSQGVYIKTFFLYRALTPDIQTASLDAQATPLWKLRFRHVKTVVMERHMYDSDFLALKKYFAGDTKFYTYMPYANSGYPESKVYDKLPCINPGYALEYLYLHNYFRFEDLYETDGVHPNQIVGYMAACLAYATLFDKSCIGLPYIVNGESLLPKGYDTPKIQAQLQKAAAAAKGKGFGDHLYYS